MLLKEAPTVGKRRENGKTREITGELKNRWRALFPQIPYPHPTEKTKETSAEERGLAKQETLSRMQILRPWR